VAAPLASELVEGSRLRAGERVLDLACGTGVVAKLAARAVGPAGRVTGLDMNPGMLAVARATTGPDAEIDWREAPADHLPFPDRSFDAALCQFGIQFFPDRSAALREVHRVLEPGGRVAASVPGPTPPVFDVLARALTANVSADAARFVQVVFSIHEPEEVAALLTDAGFGGVEARSRVKPLRIPDPAAFLWQYLASTPLATTVADMSDGDRSSFERDVLEGCRPFIGSSGLVMDLSVTTGVGRS
jgi:ubiquinone/menaquinone biosynthesis C-methylase UbiE